MCDDALRLDVMSLALSDLYHKLGHFNRTSAQCRLQAQAILNGVFQVPTSLLYDCVANANIDKGDVIPTVHHFRDTYKTRYKDRGFTSDLCALESEALAQCGVPVFLPPSVVALPFVKKHAARLGQIHGSKYKALAAGGGSE